MGFYSKFIFPRFYDRVVDKPLIKVVCFGSTSIFTN